jgi:uncharacterized protein YegL
MWYNRPSMPRSTMPGRTMPRRTLSAHRAASAILLGALLGALPFTACAAAGDTSEDGHGGEGGVGFDAGTSGGGGPGPDSACAVGTDEARLVPVNLYIMYDKSGSMLGPKWTASTAALQSFFMDPESGGLRVALRFFPDSGCDTGCNAGACAQPLVPLGELTNLSAPTDSHEQALLDAFIGQTPAGGTPLSAALDGGLLWAQNLLSTQPNEKAVVVLVTDGEPSDCNESASYFASQAATAFSSRGILTFAIGLEGSNESLMNTIASSGGTNEGFFIGTTNFEQELVAALQSIRESAVACEYQIPDQVNGNAINHEQVNVLYTPSGATDSTTIGQVVSASVCSDDKGGWYYDDPGIPTKIIFCPSTCAAIQGDLEAEIDLLFGCATVPA